MINNYLPRILESSIDKALLEFPIVLVEGARQIGKSTMVEQYINKGYKYVTFDTKDIKELAETKPSKFIESLGKKAIIDEVQKVPSIMESIKESVDKTKQKGRFILTGSVSVLDLENISETLSTRACTLVLLPMSQVELANKKSKFIETLFANNFTPKEEEPFKGKNLNDRILEGGVFELIKSKMKIIRTEAYFKDVIRKDIIDNTDKRVSSEILSEMINSFAEVTSNMLNIDKAAQSAKIHRHTYSKYIAYLKKVFIFHQLNRWDSKKSNSYRKIPKIHFCDTGLLCGLLDIFNLNDTKKDDPALYGYIFETFVFNELMRICSNSNSEIRFHFYRNKHRKEKEVDIVLTYKGNKISGIEVKSSNSVNVNDFNGIKDLQKQVGKYFVSGIVIYTGDTVRRFENNLWAIPVHLLWEIDENY